MSKAYERIVSGYGWNTIGVHDPTIVKEGSSYYMFSTDTDAYGIQSGGAVRRSEDLIHWEYLGTALDGVPEPAKEWSDAVNLWAPEVRKVGEQWYMYYSASTFGSRISCIGLATAPHPEGPWEDQGIVVKTDYERCSHNAIDANLIQDRDGSWWLCYGSFFGGIFIVELDMKTGFTKKKDDLGVKIAQRPPQVQDGAIEGPFIYYNKEQDYYYLFVSYDSLIGPYNVRVARSEQITGPYRDYNGNDMIYPEGEAAAAIGTKILGSYQFRDDVRWVAPGHNSIFEDNGEMYMVHHVRLRRRGHFSRGIIRRLFWLENGWPVVSPEYFNQTEEVLIEADLNGEWEMIWFNHDSDLTRSCMSWLGGFRRLKGGCFETESYGQCVLFPCYDWKQRKTVTGIAGITPAGTGYFGKRCNDSDLTVN